VPAKAEQRAPSHLVTTDETGRADFPTNGGGVSVWVRSDQIDARGQNKCRA
jgi:hypothetical protein